MAQNIKELSDKQMDTQCNVSDGQDEYSLLKKEQDELNDKITDVKVKSSTLWAKIENADKEIDSAKTLLGQYQTLVGVNMDQILQNKKAIEVLEAEMQMNSIQDINALDLEEVKKRLAVIDQEKTQAKEDFERADKERADYANLESGLKEKLVKAKEKRAE